VSCSRSNCLAPSMHGEPTQADVAPPQPPSGDYDAPACLAFSWRASCRVVHAGRPSNKTETPKMGPLRRPECHFLRSAGHADLLVPAMTGPGGLATRTHLEMAACGWREETWAQTAIGSRNPTSLTKVALTLCVPRPLHRQWLHWWPKKRWRFHHDKSDTPQLLSHPLSWWTPARWDLQF